ncbi:hypothetical protein EVAR_66132_1 [Eumeta japonica]|uniref:Uncharacterized protein n=1 Tax=Eumeta variegata TaxID=151549 RepID=A0A4C1YVV3_EUMVA|nr:hypothetical protein EVAR_66132_1 [Eumeta japonica]
MASRTISPSTERAKKMKMTDSMDTDNDQGLQIPHPSASGGCSLIKSASAFATADVGKSGSNIPDVYKIINPPNLTVGWRKDT